MNAAEWIGGNTMCQYLGKRKQEEKIAAGRETSSVCSINLFVNILLLFWYC